MIRTKPPKQKEYERPTKITYSTDEEPIVISKCTMDILLKTKNFSDSFALYGFYYYTAKWQKTNQPKATTTYVSKGINWGRDKVISVKKELKKLGLIEDIIGRSKDGRVSGYFIKVNFIWNINHPPENTDTGVLTTPLKKPLEVNSDINSLSTNSINSLNTNNIIFGELITPNRFDDFWKIYPRKENKRKTSIIWDSICADKKNRPLWEDIKKAIEAQKKTNQWQNPVFIKQPNTWLEDFDWERDPVTMAGRKEQTKSTNVTGDFNADYDWKKSIKK